MWGCGGGCGGVGAGVGSGQGLAVHRPRGRAAPRLLPWRPCAPGLGPSASRSPRLEPRPRPAPTWTLRGAEDRGLRTLRASLCATPLIFQLVHEAPCMQGARRSHQTGLCMIPDKEWVNNTFVGGSSADPAPPRPAGLDQCLP